MFHNLKYSVTFPATGRTLAQDLNFESGFWAITGPNEVGKSFIFEMLRYLMFGSAALRGTGEDYKSLMCQGELSIRGTRYYIERTKKVFIKRGDDVIATGITAVNEKVVQLLGFGLLVFDMANSINQGEVERLGNLTSAERKRMVDSVLGIDVFDIIAKWGSDEARLLDREIAAIQASLIVPVQPEQPGGYIPSSEIDLPTLRAKVDERNRLTGWLAFSRSAPFAPHTDVPMSVSELEPLSQALGEMIREEATLNAKVSAMAGVAVHSAEELDQAEDQWGASQNYIKAQKYIQANPEPYYLPQALVIFEDDYVVFDRIMERERLLAQKVALEAKGSKPCPHCGEDIPLEADALKLLQVKIDAIALPDSVPPTPPVKRSDIPALIRYAETWDAVEYDKCMKVPVATEPTIQLHMIPTYWEYLKQVEERKELEPRLLALQSEIAQSPNYQQMLVERRAYESHLVRYEQEVQLYNTYLNERAINEARFAELSAVEMQYQTLSVLHTLSVNYEQALATFGEAYDRYNASLSKIDKLKIDADNYRKVRQLMDLLRSLVKQHVLPSLNKVASHLLRGMTGGQRSVILVDEDFNVLVDNQRLETLSGSGKACANLSLRIALGQVLTNRVMSVLLADEIDASMDDFRAQKTSDVLYTLEQSIVQVLLVSHKSIDVPNVITLGGVNGYEPHLPGEAA